MFGENLVALLMLYARPVAAISRILDRGRLWFAIVLALVVSALVHAPSMRQEPLVPAPVHRAQPPAAQQPAAQHAPAETPAAQSRAANEDDDEAPAKGGVATGMFEVA